MLQIEMSASVRSTSGKGPMRQLRMKGMTPGIVYSGGGEAVKLQLVTKTLMAQLLEYYRKNVLVTLKIEGVEDKNVTIAEVQTDPVHDTLIHIDFYEVDLEKERAFNVPVAYTGIAKGVDMGGFLVVAHSAIALVARPLHIPDECVVDVTALEIGDSIKCGDIVIPDNVKLKTDPASVAVIVIKPGVQAEDEIDEEGEGTEESTASETDAEAETEE